MAGTKFTENVGPDAAVAESDSLTGATLAPVGIDTIERGLEDAYNALPTMPT